MLAHLISEWRREIFRTCDRDPQENCCQVYEQMRKLILEFLTKFVSRGIKIARVN